MNHAFNPPLDGWHSIENQSKLYKMDNMPIDPDGVTSSTNRYFKSAAIIPMDVLPICCALLGNFFLTGILILLVVLPTSNIQSYEII